MKLQRGMRARLGGALLAGIAAVAVLAVPGLASSHDRGHQPAADAGVISSYDPETGVLAVDLTDGGAISALVVDRTQIRCGKPHRHPHRRRGHRHRRRGHSSARASHRPSRGDVVPQGRGPRDGSDDPPGHDGTPPGASEDPGKGAEHSARCGTDDLVPGTVVKRAEIVLIDGNAYFRLICLPRPDQAGDEQPAPEPGDES